ncbi:MAG: hypothetical protein K9W44_17055 [Candidatus Lokiarchaeota archaeon]|nr:hypothetical protein [Candidatus Harpocratesius repetitus]
MPKEEPKISFDYYCSYNRLSWLVERMHSISGYQELSMMLTDEEYNDVIDLNYILEDLFDKDKTHKYVRWMDNLSGKTGIAKKMVYNDLVISKVKNLAENLLK